MSYASLTGPCLVLAIGLVGCGGGDRRVQPDTTPTKPAPQPVTPIPPPLPPPPPPASPAAAGFRTVPIDGAGSLRQLTRDLGPDRLTLVLKLNRVDLNHVRAGDTLLVPVDSASAPIDWAPFPARLAGFDSIEKFLVVSQRVQAFAAYQLGHLVYWGPTSTGKKTTPTPNGLFHTNWKAKSTISTENPDWILPWYFNIENRRGVSLHQYDLPGVPASHACVRLLVQDAEWIYRWADQWTVSSDGATVLRPGTPVLIFGDYRYGEPGPWRSLAADPSAATETEAEVLAALTRFRDSTR